LAAHSARTSPHWAVKIAAPGVGLMAGIVTHGVHNGSVTLGAAFVWPCLIAFVSDWGGVLVLLVVIVWATVREQRWITDFLADEVEGGVLSPDDYQVIRSYTRRVGARVAAFFSGDFRRWWDLGRHYHLATELAFSKRRLAHFPGEQDTQARMVQLRRQIAALQDQL
jgi:hypothetical protein